MDYAAAAAASDGESRGKRPEPHEPKFISKMDVAIYQEAAKQAERNARAAWDQADRRMQRAIDQFRSSYPTLIRFEYSLEKKAERSPFEIAGMWHDGRFTYVRSNAVEAPALYESREGKPSLVSYDLQPDGLYIVKRVLHDGFFQIGKKKAEWRRVPPGKQPDPQLRQGRITLTADRSAPRTPPISRTCRRSGSAISSTRIGCCSSFRTISSMWLLQSAVLSGRPTR